MKGSTHLENMEHKMSRVRASWILLLWLLPGPVLSALQNEPSARAEARHKVRLQKSVLVAMRDGVKLSTDLYIPEGISEKLPVILIRTPYNKNPQRRAESDAYFFAGQGYLVAVQDVRGRFESGGIFTINAAEREDGYDTVGWLSRQPWSNGKVGTYGCSYLGENQIQLAALRHPNHAAAISQAAGGVTRWAGILNGGTFELAISFGWFLNNRVNKVPISMQLGTAKVSMARRKLALSEEEIEIMKHIKQLTKEARNKMVRKGVS